MVYSILHNNYFPKPLILFLVCGQFWQDLSSIDLQNGFFSSNVGVFLHYDVMKQTVHDGRQFMKYIDPKLGVALPERDYGGNCLIYDPGNATDPFHNLWVRVWCVSVNFMFECLKKNHKKNVEAFVMFLILSFDVIVKSKHKISTGFRAVLWLGLSKTGRDLNYVAASGISRGLMLLQPNEISTLRATK